MVESYEKLNRFNTLASHDSRETLTQLGVRRKLGVQILGEKFELLPNALEMAEKYGKDYGSLAECQRVARAYKYSSRLETLGFKHHQVAAALEDRLDWLKRPYNYITVASESSNYKITRG